MMSVEPSTVQEYVRCRCGHVNSWPVLTTQLRKMFAQYAADPTVFDRVLRGQAVRTPAGLYKGFCARCGRDMAATPWAGGPPPMRPHVLWFATLDAVRPHVRAWASTVGWFSLGVVVGACLWAWR